MISSAFLRYGVFAASLLVLPLLPVAPQAFAQSSGLIATVNDFPITRLDLDLRIRMLQILGRQVSSTTAIRREVLRMMVDEVIQIAEAKRFKMNPSEREISQRYR